MSVVPSVRPQNNVEKCEVQDWPHSYGLHLHAAPSGGQIPIEGLCQEICGGKSFLCVINNKFVKMVCNHSRKH